MSHLSTWYFSFGEWMYKLFILNICWILLSLSGFIFLGVFPATVAIYATFRKDFQASGDIKLFQTFFYYFKKELVKANLYGYGMTLIGSILYLNIRIIGQLETSLLNSVLMILTYGLLILFLLVAMYFLPVYVHFQLKPITYVKYAFILLIGKPLQTIALVVCILVIFYIFYRFPVLLPFLGVSSIAYPIMKYSLTFFTTQKEA
ncbi:YesL family protein [Gracilibacillus dipsosauri]|uniref:YesL family protein n=1 Tax=Gracilibacillus dipsosauri TaxID=178340 RepID=UPI0024097301